MSSFASLIFVRLFKFQDAKAHSPHKKEHIVHFPIDKTASRLFLSYLSARWLLVKSVRNEDIPEHW